ncbi:hypothetical protein K523DRAFT_12089 [Schizophyllum commune Tattone D]|nr:hypothetical protein K523DRAFT_12089 [Schizophyllum commune Tattone D]
MAQRYLSFSVMSAPLPQYGRHRLGARVCQRLLAATTTDMPRIYINRACRDVSCVLPKTADCVFEGRISSSRTYDLVARISLLP